MRPNATDPGKRDGAPLDQRLLPPRRLPRLSRERNPPTGTPIEIERPGPGRHVTRSRRRRAVETLADLPPLRDRLLFVGLNPSPVSVEAGHYHQGQLGRAFWGRLIQATILPGDTPIDTADDALVAAGHGITDIHKVPSARDEASDAVLRAGVGPLWTKVAHMAAGGGGLRLQAGRGGGRGPRARREVGPAPRRRAVGPAVLPDARSVRPDRGGRRGPEPAPQPGRVAPLLTDRRDRRSGVWRQRVEWLAVAGVDPGRVAGPDPRERRLPRRHVRRPRNRLRRPRPDEVAGDDLRAIALARSPDDERDMVRGAAREWR